MWINVLFAFSLVISFHPKVLNKYHLHTDNSQVYICSPILTPELQTHRYLASPLRCLIAASNLTWSEQKSGFSHPSLRLPISIYGIAIYSVIQIKSLGSSFVLNKKSGFVKENVYSKEKQLINVK